MAQVIRDAFATLADTAYQPTYPAVAAPTAGRTAPEPWIRLVGLLEPNTPVAAGQNRDVTGVIDAAGSIVIDGHSYDSPPGAAKSIGAPVNGWTFWTAHTDDGPVVLDELRNRYRILRS